MLINTGSTRLVIGRISIMPGEKVPTFPLTGAEAAEVKRLTQKGVLVEKAAPRPAPKTVEAKVEKPAEKPAEKHEDEEKSRKQPKAE